MWILTSQEVLALTVVALWVKAAALSLSQVGIRVRSKRYGRPEDARMMDFVAARYAQGWAQFALRQPHRTIAFLLGFAASIAMALLVLRNMVGAGQ